MIIPNKRHNSPREYAMTHPSIAHTYGNVASYVCEYIKGLFSPGFFKTVHISTTVAYKQIAIQRARNKEVFKKSKPMLIIRPRIELGDQENFLYGTLLTERMTDLYYNRDFSNLQPFIYDEQQQVELKFLLNRLKMFFDITIVTEEQFEQINVSHYLMNRVRQNHPFFIDASLESFIPKELMMVFSKEYGIPIKDKNGSVKPFIDKLQSVSYYPITYKLKKSTGNDEFFRYYPAKIDTTFSGLGISDGSKKGFIFDSFETSFTVSTEFFATGLYFYFTKYKKYLDEINMSIVSGENKDSIIPIFTVSNLYDLKLPEGWVLYSTNMYEVDYLEPEDVLPLASLMNVSITNTIDWHNKRGLKSNLYLLPIVMKNNERLKEGTDFILDLDKKVLITKNIEKGATYRLSLYVNNRYINELVKKEYNLD